RNDDNKIYVLSMNRMIHDCVARIVGDKLCPIVLIDGSIDPHAYEMVKGDEDKMAMSRLIFCNGLGLEHTASLRKHLEGNPKAVSIGSRLLSNGAFVPLEEDGFYDPHIWT
ncbi:periplasmic solute binding family protein, partial [Chlamydia psittaci 84-8471/1]